ncbi:MAG TPA: peptidylprolyl isomerase [Tepidisphaeraceae bacterium]|nr:peptidylprolyl isomerase [Tepidisphaeraceae bacterium]
MHMASALLLLVSLLTPSRTWYPPAMPLTVNLKADGDSRLILTDFSGKVIEPKAPTDFKGEKSVDLKESWPQLASAGTYVLYEVPKDKPLAQFEGTPLVIEIRSERQEVQVVKVMPLEYVVMTTDAGPLTMAFYYDVAPVTVDSFLNLCRTGYYNDLSFHRIVPGFVIQGGDPKGNGSGGPGYSLHEEFNARPHLPGVLSMARTKDPNSAGSQFFVCLDYAQTQHLDNQYTAFGRVTEGMDAVKKIAATPLSDPQNGTPATPQIIKKTEVKPVTAKDNPYAEMFKMKDADGK